ncbi:MAG: hypothetical protein ACLRXB_01320 [Escherichia coli]
MPRIYSQDHLGVSIIFGSLLPHDSCWPAIFKGYQWPFHAERMLEYSSRWMSQFMKRLKGRDVFLIFTGTRTRSGRNVIQPARTDDDVIDYLQQNHALLAQPLARLTQMNPLAIRLYQMHGHDLQPHRSQDAK